MKEFFKKRWYGITTTTILSILIIILAIPSCNGKFQKMFKINSVNDANLNVNLLNNLTKSNDSLSLEVQVLTNENIDLEEMVNLLSDKNDSSDNVIEKLGKLVLKYRKELDNGGTVTLFNSSSSYTGNIQIDTIHDTIDNIIMTSFITFDTTTTWLDLNGSIINGNLSYNIETRDSISMVLGYSKPKKLFGKKQPYAVITSYNPNSNLDGAIIYDINAPKSTGIGLGFSAGYAYYPPLSHGPYIGVGLNFNVITFKKRRK